MLYRRAQTVLFEQFPQFETGEMQFAQGELVLMLETEEGQRYPKELMLGWLSKQAIRMNMDMNAVFEVEKP
jgi:Flp pilus assembly CpaF family ATPase